MANPADERLSDLVEAVKALPDETREALVEEFHDRLADFAGGDLTEAQRQEIDRRLAHPRYADAARVSEFFARHGIKAR